MKLHKQLYYEGKGITVNTTLCGRENKASWNTELEGTNVADSDEEVTCKFCLKMMEQKRVRKIKPFGQEVKPVTQKAEKEKIE